MTKRFVLITFLLVGLVYMSPAYGEDPPAPVANAEPSEALEGEIEVNGIMVSATEVYTTIQNLRAAEEGAKKGLILLLLIAMCKFLLSGMKIVRKHFWKTRKGKTALRLSTLGLGLVILILSRLGLGIGWTDALFYALSGPGALAFHEILGIFSGMKDEKDARPAIPG